MADGDVLHSGLTLGYQLPYRQLCEGVLSPEHQAIELAKRVKRDLKHDCERIVARQKMVAHRLEQLSEAARVRQQVDWTREMLATARMCGGSGSKRNNALLAQAAQDTANDIQEGVPVANIAQKLSRNFLKNLYMSQFGEAALTINKQPGLEVPTDIRARLEQVEPHVTAQLDHLADQMIRAKEGAKPRLSLLPRKVEKIADLDSSIDDIWD